MRLGLHWMSPEADGAFRRYVDAVRPPIVKMLDPGAGEEPLAAWCVERGVQVVGRIYFKDQFLGAAGARQLDQVVAHARACPSIRYWELHNEAWHVPGEMRRYADLSIDHIEAMRAIDRVAVIGCFSEGTPQVDGSDNDEAWRQYLPALQHAIRHGAVLGLHEYSAPHMAALTDATGRGWHTLRFAKSLDLLGRLGLDISRLLLAFTETGLDDIQDAHRVGPPGKGWRDYDGTEWSRPPLSPHGDFAGQMAWYCRELGKWPQVLGLVDFGWAPRDRASWDSFDLSVVPAMVDRMIDEMRRLPIGTNPTGGPTMTDVEAAALESARIHQGIQLNPAAGLQKVIAATGSAEGFWPTSGEFSFNAAGKAYVGQRAEHPKTGEVRVYYCPKPAFTPIRFVTRPK